MRVLILQVSTRVDCCLPIYRERRVSSLGNTRAKAFLSRWSSSRSLSPCLFGFSPRSFCTLVTSIQVSRAQVCEKFDSFAFCVILDSTPCSVVCIALVEPAMQSWPKPRWPRTFGLYTRAAVAGLLFAVLTLPFTNFRLGACVPSSPQNIAKLLSRVRWVMCGWRQNQFAQVDINFQSPSNVAICSWFKSGPLRAKVSNQAMASSPFKAPNWHMVRYRSTVELQEDVGNPFGWEYLHTVHRRLVPVITSCLVPHYLSKELIGWKNEVSRILSSRWCTGISDGISKFFLWKSHDFPIFLNQAILPTMARDIAYSLGRAALPVLTAALFEATSHDYPKTII